jgi:hypothetical protein
MLPFNNIHIFTRKNLIISIKTQLRNPDKNNFVFRVESNQSSKNKKSMMATHFLISKELDDLLFLEIINEDLREQSKILSILISSIKQTSPLVEIYEEKKKILMELLKSSTFNDKRHLILKEKLVSLNSTDKIK